MFIISELVPCFRMYAVQSIKRFVFFVFSSAFCWFFAFWIFQYWRKYFRDFPFWLVVSDRQQYSGSLFIYLCFRISGFLVFFCIHIDPQNREKFLSDKNEKQITTTTTTATRTDTNSIHIEYMYSMYVWIDWLKSV